MAYSSIGQQLAFALWDAAGTPEGAQGVPVYSHLCGMTWSAVAISLRP